MVQLVLLLQKMKLKVKNFGLPRRNASPATIIYGTKKLNEDISVPRSKLPEALDGIVCNW